MTLFSSRDHLSFFLARNQRLIIKFAIHLAHKTSYTLRVYSRFFKKHNTEYNSIYFLKSIANKCLVNLFLELFFGQIRLDVFNFPAKKLRKIWALKIRMRQIIFFFEITVSVSNICSNVLNFPAKRLRKNMCAVFFKLLYLYAAIKFLLNMRCFCFILVSKMYLQLFILK